MINKFVFVREREEGGKEIDESHKVDRNLEGEECSAHLFFYYFSRLGNWLRRNYSIINLRHRRKRFSHSTAGRKKVFLFELQTAKLQFSIAAPSAPCATQLSVSSAS
jgi:hypothetical protein